MIAYLIDSIVGLTIYCAYSMFIMVHIGCIVGSCFCRCCPCKPWIKRITLEVAQYLYGPSSITKKNQKEERVIMDDFIETIIFRNTMAIGKGTATKFALFMVIILTMTMCPWDLLLQKEKAKNKINVLQPEEDNEETKPLISNGGTATKASSL
ncbi:PREDICTED: uncharacterized protein LOC109582488 [Amphimedon queenslandica]|uniref:Uncharacterized protein n=1 Tax=Amphimedon queenslandica TaxID=400682 RepID=A0AAN0J7U8_AMPQE|nr:PREDICTED: uncharacterized protein LOC109582488 [Amphimedon queenslandica]|eukprot:XP_019852773.1 PREDICTED: uncharacterized protein LOC109582488 [Amphimedon queenslandica]